MAIIAYGGLRRGEGIGLRWDDVDLVQRDTDDPSADSTSHRSAEERPCQYCESVHRGQAFDSSKVLRHSTIELTVDSYGHLLPGLLSRQQANGATLIPRKASGGTVGHISATNTDWRDE
jgi:hypothetical protein